MAQSKRTPTSAQRMALYRRKSKQAGRHRFEVNLPAQDAELIRHAVDRIRAGGAQAEKMRTLLEHSKRPAAKIARTGKELYEILRRGPLFGSEITFERDKSLPRDVDLF